MRRLEKRRKRKLTLLPREPVVVIIIYFIMEITRQITMQIITEISTEINAKITIEIIVVIVATIVTLVRLVIHRRKRQKTHPTKRKEERSLQFPVAKTTSTFPHRQ